MSESYLITGKNIGNIRASQVYQTFVERESLSTNLNKSFSTNIGSGSGGHNSNTDIPNDKDLVTHNNNTNIRKSFNNSVNSSNNSAEGKQTISSFKGIIKKLISLLTIAFSTELPTNVDKVKKLSDLINNVVDLFTDYKMCLVIEPGLSIQLQHFFSYTMHNLIKLGDSTNFKIIFLCLNLSWPQYDKEIWKFFTETYTGIKFKKPEMERNKIKETLMCLDENSQRGNPKSFKNQYINFLCDMNVIFLIENSQHNKTLVKILNSILKGQTQREEIMLYLIKWYSFI